MPRVEFRPSGVSLEVQEGVTLLEAAVQAGLLVESPCHGSGVCGKCKLRVDAAGMASLKVSGHGPELPLGQVLACHARVFGDVRVTIPERHEKGLSILKTGHSVELPLDPSVHVRPWREPGAYETVTHDGESLAVEHGRGRCLGLAVDIGTTTLVVSLLDLEDGRELGSLSALNPQALHAGDVLSRIKMASSPEGLATLHGEIAGEVNRLAQELAGDDAAHIYDVVYAGNTCMLHLAANESPAALGKLPFRPTLRGGVSVDAKRCGLSGLHPKASVYLPPVISGFVGADITAGLLAAGVEQLPGSTLFIDVGTNGEMVLAADGRMVASSTAAGPAFEGMNISCGSRAVAGAVEYFKIKDGKPVFRTIGGAPPRSLCGTGLIDAVAELVKTRGVNRGGRLSGPSFEVAPGVLLLQKDIRQLQLAKAAVRTGIDMLLAKVGLEPRRVDRVLVAGSFGYHLRSSSLLAIGLLPEAFAGKVDFVGNTSLSGAKLLLTNFGSRAHLATLAAAVEPVNLAEDPGFQRAFVAAIQFPEPKEEVFA